MTTAPRKLCIHVATTIRTEAKSLRGIPKRQYRFVFQPIVSELKIVRGGAWNYILQQCGMVEPRTTTRVRCPPPNIRSDVEYSSRRSIVYRGVAFCVCTVSMYHIERSFWRKVMGLETGWLSDCLRHRSRQRWAIEDYVECFFLTNITEGFQPQPAPITTRVSY